MEDLFLNADLDILSDCDLQLLVDEIGDRAFLLSSGPPEEKQCSFARYEIDLDLDRRSPGQLIADFCALIESLSPASRVLWDQARQREIDLGFRMSPCGQPLRHTIPPAIMERLARLQISLAWTIYPPADDEPPVAGC